MVATVPPDILHDRQAWLRRARTLSEALPFMRKFFREIVVIGLSGSAMECESLARLVARDVVLLKQAGVYPIVVHCDGSQINAALHRLGVAVTPLDASDVAHHDAVEVAEMVLSAKVNKRIVAAINEAGGFAMGVSGRDGHLIRVGPLECGEPIEVTKRLLDFCRDSGIIPVIAPVGPGPDGKTCLIDADVMAGAIAGAICARRLLMVADAPGLLDESGDLILEISTTQAAAHIAKNAIAGDIIPKVKACIEAIKAGVGGAAIIDGRVPHAILLELFTPHGIGTMVTQATLSDASQASELR